MPPLAGPFLAAAALLVAAGAAKLRDPDPLARALRALGLGLPRPLVRLLAAGEAAVGILALVTGSRPAAALVALSYAAFTAVVLRARAVGGPLSSCGCFGRADMPPTGTHAVVTALAAGVAAVGVLHAYGPVPLDAPLLLATSAVAATAYVALAVLPLLQVRA